MAPPGDRVFLLIFLPQTNLHFTNSLRTLERRSSSSRAELSTKKIAIIIIIKEIK